MDRIEKLRMKFDKEQQANYVNENIINEMDNYIEQIKNYRDKLRELFEVVNSCYKYNLPADFEEEFTNFTNTNNPICFVCYRKYMDAVQITFNEKRIMVNNKGIVKFYHKEDMPNSQRNYKEDDYREVLKIFLDYYDRIESAFYEIIDKYTK